MSSASASAARPSGEIPQEEGANEGAFSNVADARYTFDEQKLQDLRSSAPWMKEAKYFEKVAVSPSAITKMMMHCQSGVEKGIRKGGNPIEVMGMLLGRPDPDTPRTLVVTDAFPLPVEGFETRVIADDANVVNHMISLGECLERTRREKFMGWYHSHPFDLGEHSHCFLSQTDLSTQLQWQRAEDPHGNPFVAIVLDPLRSINKSHPELKAFRAYPPEHTSNVPDECPNGAIITSEQQRLEQWGSCWNRYYELPVEYYMSSSARRVMEKLTQDYLWMRTLGTTPLSDPEHQKRICGCLTGVANKMKTLDVANSKPGAFSASTGAAGSGSAGGRGGGSRSNSGDEDQPSHQLQQACTEVVDLAREHLHAATIKSTKQQLFGNTN
mmetsp:Transcript_18522/g.28591  ORF Transcript_18522/g.28591 Transcript_18522/m.28591 type:complete len:384 (-) Transcript_18522:45-1196(-)|eukprot:CAMPEP_0195281502 /NCGR_PEP_ID=MMETSP0707-20130614/788_1 /TAXON_ID=33640 /ORGANISM="Asterionellopsis glacialis, Strain CCMP134" /LENGTH=383 /DNA_ID=CAMNT_0040340395 /DNA_START=52 /DNA_END=1203 /DNA_ORIENTATION=+